MLGCRTQYEGNFVVDDQVDRAPVRLGQVEEPPEERLVEHARPRVPLERDGDQLGLVIALAQLVDELVREDLGAPANEGHLRSADRNPHRRLLQLGLELRDALLEVVDQPQRRRVEGALVVRDRLHVPPHQLAQHCLRGRAEPTANSRAEPERTVGRHRPEPLGLGTGGMAIVAASRLARSSARAPDLLLQLLEEGCDIDVAVRRNPCKLAIFCALIGHRRIVPGNRDTLLRCAWGSAC